MKQSWFSNESYIFVDIRLHVCYSSSASRNDLKLIGITCSKITENMNSILHLRLCYILLLFILYTNSDFTPNTKDYDAYGVKIAMNEHFLVLAQNDPQPPIFFCNLHLTMILNHHYNVLLLIQIQRILSFILLLSENNKIKVKYIFSLLVN
jgi:hypothetical protein